ncbi:MAG: hypothetical protein JJE17_05945 [Peptostreptococcaceae bacterium]|nr:hypothetical protein [Peptostreptococcaceae bacterium]
MANSTIYWNGNNSSDLPKDILVDTNVFLNLLSIDDYRKDISKIFLNHCINNNISLYFSGIHESELRHKLMLARTKKYAKDIHNIDYEQVLKYKGPGGYKYFYEDIEKLDCQSKLIVSGQINIIIDEIKKVTQLLPANLDSSSFEKLKQLRQTVPFEVENNDLLAIIHAEEYGINTEVSFDAGLKHINNFNLIKLVPDTTRVLPSVQAIPFSEGCIYL